MVGRLSNDVWWGAFAVCEALVGWESLSVLGPRELAGDPGLDLGGRCESRWMWIVIRVGRLGMVMACRVPFWSGVVGVWWW